MIRKDYTSTYILDKNKPLRETAKLAGPSAMVTWLLIIWSNWPSHWLSQISLAMPIQTVAKMALNLYLHNRKDISLLCSILPLLTHYPILKPNSNTFTLNPTLRKKRHIMPTSKTVAFISGANSGIGLAAATQLAKDHGYHVIIGSRNAAAGEKVVAALISDGHSASSVQLDVTSDESITAAVRKVEQEFGVLDVLVNNAGILIDKGGIESRLALPTRELFDRTLSTNIIGAACLTEACLPLLRKAELPRLVFVSSRMGSVSEATNKQTVYYGTDYKAYDCSKAALNMLALNYARMMDDGNAMVNVVCPGLVKTKLTNETRYGTSTEVGAQRIVELATAAKGGPTFSFTDRDGVIPW